MVWRSFLTTTHREPGYFNDSIIKAARPQNVLPDLTDPPYKINRCWPSITHSKNSCCRSNGSNNNSVLSQSTWLACFNVGISLFLYREQIPTVMVGAQPFGHYVRAAPVYLANITFHSLLKKMTNHKYLRQNLKCTHIEGDQYLSPFTHCMRQLGPFCISYKSTFTVKIIGGGSGSQ